MRKNILSKVICIVAAFFLALALAGLCLPGSAVAASKIKSVTFESNDLDFTLGQSKATVAFKLNVKAAKAVVSIRNSDGKVVYSVTKKSVKKNKRVTVQWNGKDSGGSYVKPGKYYARVKVGKVYKNSAKMEVFEKEQEQGTETKDFAGGKGTEADPYQIATYQQLRAIERYNGKYFIQTADIDAGYETVIALFTNDIPFTGTFNGNGHKISNAMITGAIFQSVGVGGTVKGMEFYNTVLNNDSGESSACVAVNNYGTISDCKAVKVGFSTGLECGVICARNHIDAVVSRCTVENVVLSGAGGGAASEGRWGGIVADNEGKVIWCIANNIEINNTNNHSNAGGIVAINKANGTVINCQTTGTINILRASYHYDGDVVGTNNGTVSGCTTTSGNELVGRGNPALN